MNIHLLANAGMRALNGGNDILLFIRSQNEQSHGLEIPSDSTVGDVINFAREAGFIAQSSWLSFGGRPLSADEILSDAGICSESVLNEVRIPDRFESPQDIDDEPHRFEIFDDGNRLKFMQMGDFDNRVRILTEVGKKEIEFKVLRQGKLVFFVVGYGEIETHRYSGGEIVKVSIEGDICKIYCDGIPDPNLEKQRVDYLTQTPKPYLIGGMPTQYECRFWINYASHGAEIGFTN